LEWGCGVGRIVRHLPGLLEEDIKIYACDINANMIEWDKKNLPGVIFSLINCVPPTVYDTQMFDLVYAFSVLTHIQMEEQEKWIAEVHRVLKDGGIFLFTTHGNNFFHQLSKKEKKILHQKGSYTRSFWRTGHRMMTTYNNSKHLNALLGKYFIVQEFYDGEKYISKAGGQDLWIVQKKFDAIAL
jgi:ubiquinone/menaquinone biosynthesis C-methylase UbiE